MYVYIYSEDSISAIFACLHFIYWNNNNYNVHGYYNKNDNNDKSGFWVSLYLFITEKEIN